MSDMNATDMLALANNIKGNDGMMGGNSSWLWWVLILVFLFNGNAWGGNSAAQNALTRAEMQDGFNNQNLVNGLTNMSNQINCGFDGITLGMTNGFNSVNQSIAGLSSQMAQQCCDLRTAMHAEGEATRALITNNTIQDLRDKVQAKDLELAQSNILSINQNQTVNLENFMRSLCGCNSCCGC